MELQEAVYIGLFSVLYFSKHTRLASIVFVLSMCAFYAMHYALPNGYTYAASGTVNLFIFLSLVTEKSRTYFSTDSSERLWRVLNVCVWGNVFEMS